MTDFQPVSTASKPPKASLFDGASPKLTFVMGLVTGVAAVALIGFVVVLAGEGLNRFGSAAAGTGRGNNVAATQPTTQQPATNQPTAPAKVSITVRDGEYVRGDMNAPVTVVEYSDLECPFCKRFHPSMLQLMKEYAGKVRWVYRHFPLSFHQNAQKEAEASECVGKLGGNDKFWKFVDAIYDRTTSNGTGFALDKLAPLAREVGVSSTQFTSCLNSGQFTAKVQADEQEGTNFGVQGTPTTFVNGVPVEGAVPYEQLKAVVDQALKS